MTGSHVRDLSLQPCRRPRCSKLGERLSNDFPHLIIYNVIFWSRSLGCFELGRPAELEARCLHPLRTLLLYREQHSGNRCFRSVKKIQSASLCSGGLGSLDGSLWGRSRRRSMHSSSPSSFMPIGLTALEGENGTLFKRGRCRSRYSSYQAWTKLR
jgi:hypothetical protein